MYTLRKTDSDEYTRWTKKVSHRRILKIGQYLTKICVDYTVAYFFGPPSCTYHTQSHITHLAEMKY